MKILIDNGHGSNTPGKLTILIVLLNQTKIMEERDHVKI